MATPTWDDTEPVFEETQAIEPAAPAREIGMLEAGALGSVKGVTLGFDDEIAGAAGALLQKLGSNSPEDFWTLYSKIRDNVRQTHAEAEEAQPGASIVGELAGSLVLPVPGLAAVKGAGFAAKAAAMAKTGAKAGAIAGLGLSDADLTKGELGEAARDTAGGALLGGATGAGLQAIGTGLTTAAKGAGKIAKSFPIVQDLTETYSRTKAGEELLGQVNELSQANRDTARDLIDTLEQYRLEAGKLMSSSMERVDASGIKANLQKSVQEMRERLANMDPVDEFEKKDVENFKKVLSNILKEEEKEINRVVRVIKPPKASNLEKAEDTVAKKTAAAQARDLIKQQEIKQEIERLEDLMAQTSTPEEYAALDASIAKLRDKSARLINETEFPPMNILDETTGLPVKGVSRGINKQPITETIMPQPVPVFEPIQIQTTKVTNPTRTEATASELNEILRSLGTSYEKSETHVGKDLASELKNLLSKELEGTVMGAPEAQQAAQGYSYAKGGFKDIARTQEALGLPSRFGLDAERKVEAINRLQRAIQESQKPGAIGKQVLEEALTNLEKIDADMANEFRKRVSEGSRSEYLAREIAKESALSKDPYSLYASGKSIALLGARAAGKAARATGEAASGPSQSLLKLGNKVYEAAPDQLKTMADLATSQGKSFAPVLNKIVNAPLNKRKALLFTLMQQPDFREFAKSLTGGEDSE